MKIVTPVFSQNKTFPNQIWGLGLLGVTASLGLFSSPAYGAGLTLNGTAGEWSNPVGGTEVIYQTIENESQIRWGSPAYGVSPTAGKSGLGFTGIGTMDLEVGEVFNVGTLTHYNKTIWSGTAASSADLKLDLAFDFGSKSFNFTMNVDETPNSPDANPGGVCPYFTTENGCSDGITWSNQISDNTFAVGKAAYRLNLVGFSETMDLSTITEQFISQEGMSSNAYIFARIDQVDNPAQDVPEPTALVGFGLMGWAIARSHRASDTQ